MSQKVNFLSDEEFSERVANHICHEACQSISKNNEFNLVLSGGNTPVAIFKKLVSYSDRVNWKRINIFWLDERCVPVDSGDSNFGSFKRNLLELLPEKPIVYPMYLTGSAQESARQYQKLLKLKFKKENPVFDCLLLGIGADGHVASMFPGIDEVKESDDWVVTTISPNSPKQRISLTIPVINLTRKIVVIAKGTEKKWVYEACLQNEPDFKVPATLIKPENGDIEWFVSF